MIRRMLLLVIVFIALGMLGARLLRTQVLDEAGIQLPSGRAGEASLTLPPGFQAQIYAAGFKQPRFMAVGPDGTLFLAERGRDRVVALPDADRDGRADYVNVIAEGLVRPSSLSFGPARADGSAPLYIGETTRVTMLDMLGQEVRANQVVVDDLPGSGSHTTRTVQATGSELLVSIGSSCNACIESDPRRAAVMAYDLLGGAKPRLFATGLRNAVGLDLNPWTGQVWASNNGRDMMGNDEPPDTVHALREGMDGGWPRCHAGRIPDPQMGQPEAAAVPSDPCSGTDRPLVEIQAHSAPLGIAFYDGSRYGAFPAPYANSLYIAYHGSWNRVPPTGYKVVRVPLSGGQVAGPPEDFATGWLLPSGDSLGRPVGVTVASDGALLISDDKGGYIYRVTAGATR